MKLLFLILFLSFFLSGKSQTFSQENINDIEKTGKNSNIKEVNSVSILTYLFDETNVDDDYYFIISSNALNEKINKVNETYFNNLFIPCHINNTTLSLIDLPPPSKSLLD